MKDKYIKITNTADIVPRIALEKLGLSMKRNDPTTIGQFGSGIKFAPIAAVRRGWDWVFTGKDDQGFYSLRYKEVEESGIPCIEYDYGDYQKSSSFTTDAGALSWIDPFQIYREAVSNAMDGAITSGGTWSVDLVKEVGEPVDGEFTVYITAAPEIMEIHNSFNKYFSVNREVVREISTQASVLSKGPYDNTLRIYCHNVLVGDYENYQSLYDYNFDNISLNEERTVKSEWSLRYEIFYTLVHPPDETMRKVLSAVKSGENFFELDCIISSTSDTESYLAKNSWSRVFCEMFGENAVAVQESLMDSHSYQLSLRNKVAIAIPDGNAFAFMKRAGISTIQDVISEEISYDIDYEIDHYPRLIRAMNLCAKAEPEYRKFMDKTFVLRNSDLELLGLTINMKKSVDERVILVDEQHAKISSMEEIVATILHEFDHAQYSVKDSNDHEGRKFRDLADRRIGQLVCKHYSDDTLSIVNGNLAFDPQQYPEIGKRAQVEYSEVLNRVIMRTKAYTYIIDCEYSFDNNNVSCFFDDKIDMFVFNDIHNVKEIKVV